MAGKVPVLCCFMYMRKESIETTDWWAFNNFFTIIITCIFPIDYPPWKWPWHRARNCDSLVANATKNWLLVTRFSELGDSCTFCTIIHKTNKITKKIILSCFLFLGQTTHLLSIQNCYVSITQENQFQILFRCVNKMKCTSIIVIIRRHIVSVASS